MNGYLFIDHRNSPGMPDEVMMRAGYPAGSGKGLFECDTLKCAHCGSVQIKNTMRSRERGKCGKCNSYVCDGCAARLHATMECTPITKLIDQLGA